MNLNVKYVDEEEAAALEKASKDYGDHIKRLAKTQRGDFIVQFGTMSPEDLSFEPTETGSLARLPIYKAEIVKNNDDDEPPTANRSEGLGIPPAGDSQGAVSCKKKKRKNKKKKKNVNAVAVAVSIILRVYVRPC